MNHKISFLAGSLALACIMSVAAEDAAEKTASTGEPIEVNAQFENARERFDKGDLEGSANSISAAAEMVRADVAKTDPQVASVMKAARGLDALSEEVRQGRIDDAGRLNQVFSETSDRMAEYHQAMAEEALTRKDQSAAGNALRWTADYIDHGAKWSGEKLSEAGKVTVVKLRAMGEALRNAGEKTVEGTEDVLKNSREYLTEKARLIKEKGKKIIKKGS